MAGVVGNWNADLSINGKPVPLHQNMFTNIAIRSNMQYNLPSFSIGFNDIRGYILSNYDIGDGVPVSLTIGDGKGGEMGGDFVMVGGTPDLVRRGGVANFTIQGVMDNMNYLRKIVDKHHKGTTSSAISEIASQVGLSFVGDSTSDDQVWLPNRLPLVQYVRFLAERGWRSATSCMLTAVNDMGQLLYKDIDSIIGSGSKGTVGYGSGKYWLLDAAIASKSGFYNNQRGYGSTSIVEGLDGVVKEFNKVTATRLSNFMNIGQKIVAGIGDIGGRIDVNPIDSGNVHEKYFEALHQNRRIKSTYGEDINVLLMQCTNLSLLDLFTFDPSGGEDFGMAKYAGDFMVTGKVATIQNGMYMEKLQLTTQGGSGQGG